MLYGGLDEMGDEIMGVLLLRRFVTMNAAVAVDEADAPAPA